jgi:hypothetical protein
VPIRVYKTRLFDRFARRERIADRSLVEAIARAERGLVDADLGGGLIKQRVARPGEGRSSGYRTLIACRFGDFAVFLFGFAKSERDNVRDDELRELRVAARAWLQADKALIERARDEGVLIEASDGDQR